MNRMQGCGPLVIAGAVATMVSGHALANDSTAELGAGGLLLIQNDKVRLLSEDLYIAEAEVRVSYRFRNISDAPFTSLVAFPLPSIDAITPQDMNIILPEAGKANFVDFTVAVDGSRLTPSLYERASIFGIDRTDELRALNLPLNPIAEGLYQQLETLPREDIMALNRQGLVVDDPYGAMADWKYEATFYWEQTFPPGREVLVEHSYRPVVGFAFFYDALLDDPVYRATYCIDEAFAAAARRRLASLRNADSPYLSERRISYILTTAANWAGPIGRFHVTIDKGETDALVSFCAEGVRKTGPTTFEWSKTDYVPDRDLQILILRSPKP